MRARFALVIAVLGAALVVGAYRSLRRGVSVVSSEASPVATPSAVPYAVGGLPGPRAPTPGKVALLREILEAGNDNDPRLDTEFNDLSAAAKAELIAWYDSLPRESFNARGTVVFLLGRNVSGPEDLRFLERVVAEPPCRSVSRCDEPAPLHPAADGHPHEDHSEVVRAYPRLLAVRAAARAVRRGGALERAARRLLRRASHSPIDGVAETARSFRRAR